MTLSICLGFVGGLTFAVIVRIFLVVWSERQVYIGCCSCCFGPDGRQFCECCQQVLMDKAAVEARRVFIEHETKFIATDSLEHYWIRLRAHGMVLAVVPRPPALTASTEPSPSVVDQPKKDE